MKSSSKIKIVSGTKYFLIEKSKVREYIFLVAKKEWDEEDFLKYGDDLENAEWHLEIVSIDKVKPNPELVGSKEFLKDLSRRMKVLGDNISNGKPIYPLILRGEDYLIFDGYARLYVLRELGVKECLAYVGR